jgi:signal transduction histidine kinase
VARWSRSLRRASLRTRLALTVAAVALVALVVADVVTYQQLHSFLYEQVDSSLTNVESAMAIALYGPIPGSEAGGPGGSPLAGSPNPFPPNHHRTAGYSNADCGIPPAVLEQFAPGTFVQVRSGSRVLTSCMASPTAGVAVPELPATIPGYSTGRTGPGAASVTFTAPAESGGAQFRVHAENLVDLRCEPGRPPVHASCSPTDGGPAVGFTVLVAESLAPTANTLGRLRDVELAVTAAALLAALVLGWWLVRLGLRPLRAVESTAAAIAQGELDQRVPGAEANTEVGRVARALNVMLGRIETAFGERDATEAELRESEGRMRQFVADASHELRTPLAAISAYAELFERGASTRAGDLERVMVGIASEAGRMSHLVEDLLLLARLDDGRPLDRQPVELVALAGEAVQTARTVAPGWPVTLAAREPLEVIGDSVRLRQVLDNLLANVRAHTPPGTTTDLGIARDGHWAVITCADRGPGLDKASADRVFERFFRADPSRSRQHGGAGLGLSIVESIVRAHGGTVAVASRPGQGATFRVQLPLDTASLESRPPPEPAATLTP